MPALTAEQKAQLRTLIERKSTVSIVRIHINTLSALLDEIDTLKAELDYREHYTLTKECQVSSCRKPAVTIITNNRTGREYKLCQYHSENTPIGMKV